MGNPNHQLLVDAAKLLRPILGELVFVGGCSTGLLVTDRAAADVRPTTDVDAIAEITSYVGYIELSERLKKLGFREDAREGAPRCRWRQNTTTLDVMPADGTLFGFRNVWYGPAVSVLRTRTIHRRQEPERFQERLKHSRLKKPQTGADGGGLLTKSTIKPLTPWKR